jgi:hypothetical protein
MNKFLSTELYILISLYNYFIMHDIKYSFLNKINQTIQERIFQGGAITENSEIKYGLCGRIGVCAADPHEFVTCGHI